MTKQDITNSIDIFVELCSDMTIITDEETSKKRTEIGNSDRNTNSAKSLSRNDNQKHNDCSLELRPKFAILKHKSELINQGDLNNRKAVAAPAWFFNIPTTRSPFADFGGTLNETDQ